MDIDVWDTSSDKIIRGPSNAAGGGNATPLRNSSSNIPSEQRPVNPKNLLPCQTQHVAASSSQVFSRADAAEMFSSTTRNNDGSSNPAVDTESELPLVHSTFDHSDPPVVQAPRKPKLPRYRSRDRKRKPQPMVKSLEGQRMAKKKRVNSEPYFNTSKMTSTVNSCPTAQHGEHAHSSATFQEIRTNQNAQRVGNGGQVERQNSNKGGNEIQAKHCDVNSKMNSIVSTKPRFQQSQRQNVMMTRQRAAQREPRLAKRFDSSVGDDLSLPVQNLSIDEGTHVHQTHQQSPPFHASLTNLCRDDRLRKIEPSLSQNRVRILEKQVLSNINRMRKALNVPELSLSPELCQAGKTLTEYLSGTGTLQGNIAPFQYFSYTFMSSPNDAVHENAKKLEQYLKDSQAVVGALCDGPLTEIGVSVSGSGRLIIVTIVKNGHF